MNGLTKQEKKQMEKAMELVDRGETYSCAAIYDASHSNCLGRKYSRFYQQMYSTFWLPPTEIDFSRTDWRLLLMAWFAEVGPGGIE